MRPPVLRTKLRPPAAAPGWIERTRLVDRLRDSAEPIWVVTAPAGYGKTTLVARVVEREGLRAAWLSVDTGDDAPVRFWTHVVAALSEVGVDADAANVALLEGELDRALDEVVAALEQDGGPVVLVLDDVHEITDERVLVGVERLVAQPPSGLRIAVTTRQELDLGLARRRSHGAVLDVTAADLAFTTEEGRAALATEVADGVVDDETALALVERTAGWPAGVWLGLLALRSGRGASGREVLDAVGGSSPEVMRYLTAEVLAGLDADVRRFLVDTSILTDLTPGVCDAVTGRSDGLAILRRLVADQVFTSLVDPATSTFRTHRLFREFLRSELESEPEEHRRRLHGRAAAWFAGTDDLDRLVWHAVNAGDLQLALRTIAERLIESTNRGQMDDMWRWIEWIGAERVLRDPELAAIPAWVAVNQRRYDEIDPWLDAIELVDDVDPAHRRDFDVHAAAVRASRDRHLGLLDSAIGHGADAMRLLESSHDELVVPTVLAIQAQLLALTGDRTAIDLARRSIDLAAAARQEPPLVMAYAALGLAVLDEDAAAAEAAADSALSLVTDDDLERFHRPAIAHYVRAHVALDAGRVADAVAAATRSAEIAAAGDEPAVAVLAETVVARARHLLGEDDERRRALRRADAVASSLSGAGWIDARLRAAHAATRFAPGAELDRLPIGARELSDRELAVLRLLPYGLSRRELAAQLYVSENTLKTHLTSIRRKLGVRGRDDVVGRARELGLLDD